MPLDDRVETARYLRRCARARCRGGLRAVRGGAHGLGSPSPGAVSPKRAPSVASRETDREGGRKGGRGGESEHRQSDRQTDRLTGRQTHFSPSHAHAPAHVSVADTDTHRHIHTHTHMRDTSQHPHLVGPSAGDQRPVGAHSHADHRARVSCQLSTPLLALLQVPDPHSRVHRPTDQQLPVGTERDRVDPVRVAAECCFQLARREPADLNQIVSAARRHSCAVRRACDC
eukprot:1733099-Rhodomonas_salina.3